MGQQDLVRDLAVEQRRRLVGSLMDFVERQVYVYLPEENRRALRDKVLASVGVYHDFMLDVLRATVTDDVVTNEEAIVLLRSIHQAQTRLTRALDTRALDK